MLYVLRDAERRRRQRSTDPADAFDATEPVDCAWCAGHGHVTEAGQPTVNKRAPCCLHCGGSGVMEPVPNDPADDWLPGDDEPCDFGELSPHLP